MRLALPLVAALCAIASSGLPHAQQEPPPTFRAGIDLLTVEASVLDRDGRPVADLQPSDFSVRVAGKPRKVLFARFSRAESSGARETTVAISPGVASHVTNAAVSGPGRIVTFVVNRDSIQPGNEKAMLDTAGAVIDSLGPGDAVGLVGIPGPSIDLTREHARVREALGKATGTRPRQMIHGRDRNITWNEALAYENRDLRVMKEVVDRECNRVEVRCPQQLIEQARELLAIGRAHAQSVLNVLNGLTRQLAPLRGSKHIVMLSGGLLFGQDLVPSFEDFGRTSAAAQVVFYAIQLDQPDSDVTDRRVVVSAFGGRDMSQGLTALAGMTGGAYFNAVGRATGIFDRIKVEMDNFYELAIETLPEDAGGRPRDIEVKVNRPGVSVRARRQVTLLDSATAAARRTDPVTTLLEQPTDIAELPLAVTAFTTRGGEVSRLRVVLSGEIGTPQTRGPIEWGFVVLNAGDVAARGRARTDESSPGPWTVTTSASLAPGSYRLRLVASDADGRAGAADVPLLVGLRAAGPLQVSDLIVGTADGGRLQPRAQMDRGAAASALIELYSNDPAQLEKTTAVLEIIPAGTTEPVQRYLMARRSSPISGVILVAEGDFTTATLTPGKYTASVVALLDNRPVGRISRAFELK